MAKNISSRTSGKMGYGTFERDHDKHKDGAKGEATITSGVTGKKYKERYHPQGGGVSSVLPFMQNKQLKDDLKAEKKKTRKKYDALKRKKKFNKKVAKVGLLEAQGY
jgi:hypothetical protein